MNTHLHVARGEHALDAGGGAVRGGHDVTRLIQLQLAAQELGRGLVTYCVLCVLCACV